MDLTLRLIAAKCEPELANAVSTQMAILQTQLTTTEKERDALAAELKEAREQVPFGYIQACHADRDPLTVRSMTPMLWPRRDETDVPVYLAAPVPPAAAPYANWNPGFYSTPPNMTANFGTEPFVFPECVDGVFTTDTTVAIKQPAAPVVPAKPLRQVGWFQCRPDGTVGQYCPDEPLPLPNGWTRHAALVGSPWDACSLEPYDIQATAAPVVPDEVEKDAEVVAYRIHWPQPWPMKTTYEVTDDGGRYENVKSLGRNRIDWLAVVGGIDAAILAAGTEVKK